MKSIQKISSVYLYTSNLKHSFTVTSKYKIITDVSNKRCARPENYTLLIEINKD